MRNKKFIIDGIFKVAINMQHNLQQKNKSHILRSTEEAKRKSRHRLMGSIFLLLIALIVLLNVTSRVKPIPVNPQTITIQNTNTSKSIIKQTSSAPTAKQLASQPTLLKPSASQVITSNAVSPSDTAAKTRASDVVLGSADEIQQAANGYKATVIKQSDKPNENKQQISDTQDQANVQSDGQPIFSAKIVIEKTPSKLSPAQILNGETATGSTNRYFIQLLASRDKNKILQVKQTLYKNGVNTFLQQVQADNNGATIYRLRIGPFKTKEEANNKLASLNNHAAN